VPVCPHFGHRERGRLCPKASCDVSPKLNPYLEFIDKDHANLRAYWTTIFAGNTPNAPARIAAVGWERNELVRVNGKC
jgi:hypothetical protein